MYVTEAHRRIAESVLSVIDGQAPAAAEPDWVKAAAREIADRWRAPAVEVEAVIEKWALSWLIPADAPGVPHV